MANRRDFIKKTALGTLGISTTIGCKDLAKGEQKAPVLPADYATVKPIIISTWKHGFSANESAWNVLTNGGSVIDAVEAGVMVSEGDPNERSVGLGGLPDREGKVTLDACIMDHNSNCGAVSFLQGIKHPISVARKVMEDTPHVMLTGAGALKFALSKGFKEENLLTPESERDWKKWLEKSNYKPIINIENHDTISMLALDENNNLSGGCTTSGAAWKMHGRVGDSPIIGAGLFLDNTVGAAAATGLGEAVIRTAGSAMVVEQMRMGKSPAEACKTIVERIYTIHKNHKDMDYLQVGFIALNKQGEYGGYSLRSGFDYAVCDGKQGNRMEDASFKMEWNEN
ncbi:isoaspartyl peptidase/L-asparaginase family protein [Aestuariivivens sediminis]|uniref:isoaspartyl peptidase/L-asparaginase family protein n=1 Tax=Aestuariivivens sediminis TaxID=2913557 RepID=UPI001F59E4FD|nr:N(4)-(beta-N-acetylglucosaminyl)-L-asparaginase [Aestuariivivens sediminis]